MTIFSSRRFLIALSITITGALLAAQIDGYWSRTIAIIMTSVIAVAFILDEGVGATRKHPDGKNRDLLNPINEHQEFATLINALPHPFLVISKNRILSANLSAIQLLGTPLIGQNIAGAFRHSAIIEKLTENNRVSENNIAISGLGQRNQRWNMTIQPFGNGNRLVQLFDKSVNHAAEKMRVDFVANASHELLTPLASIKGFIEALEDESTANDLKIRNKFLKIIADESQRMELLIRDLMSLSRIEAGAFADRTKDVTFAKIAKQAIDSLIQGSNKRGSDIILEMANDLPRVAGDEELLRQMIINIIANSMKYAQKDTPIQIRIEKSQSGSMILFSVKDQGDGIATEHIPRLTERFYRVDSGRSKSLGGTGLGLSLVKHIVQRHRGHMDITSKKGDGTLISILLPIAAIDQKNINHISRAKRTIEE